jgi:hypothetical protein
VPEPSTLRPGAEIRLDVADGWIIPEGQRPSQAARKNDAAARRRTSR